MSEEGRCVRLGQGGLCEGRGTILKILKGGGTKKRGDETKILKKGSKLGQGTGALKMGGGGRTPLHTMVHQQIISGMLNKFCLLGKTPPSPSILIEQY